MLPEIAIELDFKGKRYRDVVRGLEAVAKDADRTFEEMGPIVRKTLIRYMKGVVKSVQDRTGTAYPSGTSPKGAFPGTLSKRSGKLHSSLTPSHIKSTKATSKEQRVSFTLTGIANVHERGATITPKKAQYLTIPLPAALTARGVPKKPNARAWKDTFVLKSKKGNLLIVQKTGKGQLTPLYVLKKKVVIPKRLAFEEAFLAGRDLLADEIAVEVLREFNHG